jgi:arylsulfatase A-like enzyme
MKLTNFTTTVFTYSLLITLSIANAQIKDASQKPNIIVILADDMGYADAGFTGATDILTPNLDKLAKSGVIFTNGYVTQAFCAPSRAGLLTGKYQERFGFDHLPAYDPANSHLGIDVNEILFPAILQKEGYYTGCIGKWHLGAASPFIPTNRGFDYYYGFLGGGHDYFKIDVTKPVEMAYYQGLIRNTQPADFKGYLTTSLSQDAVKFVGDHKDKPFFLYLAYNAPHQPLQAPKEDIARYAHIKDPKRRVYAAMVDVMDRGIGEVIKTLKENGIYENTLLFFLSDNGGPIASERKPNKGNGSTNTPFRGGKAMLYEGGVHVPFIASWPAVLKGGQTYDKPVISLDIASTALAAAGFKEDVLSTLDGIDLKPYLIKEKKGVPHDALYWKFYGAWSILTSDSYKCIRDTTSLKTELFFLNKDIGEKNDLVGKSPHIASELRKKWELWDKKNISPKIGYYIEYFRKREAFYLEEEKSKLKKGH